METFFSCFHYFNNWLLCGNYVFIAKCLLLESRVSSSLFKTVVFLVYVCTYSRKHIQRSRSGLSTRRSWSRINWDHRYVAISGFRRYDNAQFVKSSNFHFGFIRTSHFFAMFNVLDFGLQPPPGIYIAALLTALLGTITLYSSQNDFLMSTFTQRATIISVLSFSHLLSLYAKFESSVREGVYTGTYE